MMEFIQRNLEMPTKVLILIVIWMFSIGCSNDKNYSSKPVLECLLDGFISELPVESNSNRVIGVGVTDGWTDSTSHIMIIEEPFSEVNKNNLHAKYKGFDIYLSYGKMEIDSLGIIVVSRMNLDSMPIPNKMNWEKVAIDSSKKSILYELHPSQLQVIYSTLHGCIDTTITGSTIKLKALIKSGCKFCGR